MTTEQEALRLASELEAIVSAFGTPSSRNAERDSAAMLRKLVAEREADRAAMRRALEALEWHAAGCGEDSVPDATVEAITDLRKRLEGTT